MTIRQDGPISIAKGKTDMVTGTFHILAPKKGRWWKFIADLAFLMREVADKLDHYGYEIERTVYLHDEPLEFVDVSRSK